MGEVVSGLLNLFKYTSFDGKKWQAALSSAKSSPPINDESVESKVNSGNKFYAVGLTWETGTFPACRNPRPTVLVVEFKFLTSNQLTIPLTAITFANLINHEFLKTKMKGNCQLPIMRALALTHTYLHTMQKRWQESRSSDTVILGLPCPLEMWLSDVGHPLLPRLCRKWENLTLPSPPLLGN